MALQVWLPLNGDCKNKGANGNIIMTPGTSVTYTDDGKLGKCLSCNGSAQETVYDNNRFADLNYTDNFSWTLWINPVYTGTTSQWAFTVGRADMPGYGYGIQCASSTECRVMFGNLGYNIPTKSGEWTHVAFVKNGDIITIYINGVLNRTATFSGTLPTYESGCGLGVGCFYYASGSKIYPFYGKLNDLRIYDHCLSPKEVKEIAQGLVLHYKLNDPLTGVVFYDYLQSTGTQWIDTGVKGYMNHTYEVDFQQTDTGNYRIWGVLGQSSYIGYNMSLTYGDGWIARWNSTSNGQAYISLGAINTNRHIFKVMNGQCYFDNVNKGTSTSHNSNFSIDNNLFLFTINPANATPSSNSKCKIYSYKDIDLNGRLIRHMVPCTYNGIAGMWDKVENKFYGNSGTGTFTLGSQLSITSDIIDSSGYNNNGTITGNLTLSDDTPRYNSSTVFDGSNSIIKGTLNLSTDYKYTASFWIKPKIKPTGTQWIFAIGSGNNHQFGCYVNGSSINTQVGGTVASATSVWSNQINADTLYHIAVVSDGENVTVYVNGIMLGTRSKNGTTTGTILWIGQRFGSPGNYNFNGLLSDFRIYSTALSEDDVLQLYRVGASIDNMGNIHSYEFDESESNCIEKTGVSNFNIKEQDTIAKIYKQVNPNLLQGTQIDSFRYERTTGMSTEFGRRFTPTQQLQTGTYYTFSALVRGNANMSLYTINTGGNQAFTYINKEDMDENEFRLFSVTFRVTGDRTINQIYPCSKYGESNTLVGDWYEIKENSIKLEEGEICTPWIPSETDDGYRAYNGMFGAKQFIET